MVSCNLWVWALLTAQALTFLCCLCPHQLIVPKPVRSGQLRRLKARSSSDTSVGTEPAHCTLCACCSQDSCSEAKLPAFSCSIFSACDVLTQYGKFTENYILARCVAPRKYILITLYKNGVDTRLSAIADHPVFICKISHNMLLCKMMIVHNYIITMSCPCWQWHRTRYLPVAPL